MPNLKNGTLKGVVRLTIIAVCAPDPVRLHGSRALFQTGLDLRKGKDEIFLMSGAFLASPIGAGFASEPLLRFAACAGVAELVDAPDLGSGAYGVGVRVPSPAPLFHKISYK
jgi:hypothetical protein